MLAYVFWHWKQPAIDAQQYVAWLRAFHAALAAAPPDGFIRSRAYGLAGAPWADQGRAAYEDWYLVRDSAALDPLNAAAVSAQRQPTHDAVAGAVAGGIAGLYRLRLGDLLESPRYATWFGKPAGMSYVDFFEVVQPSVAAHHAALWGRQMTLGPTPEFCLHSVEAIELPAALESQAIQLRAIWPDDQ